MKRRGFSIRIIILLALFSFFPGLAQADGTFLFFPSSATLNVGDSANVELRLDTGGSAVNAAESELQFPADKLEITTAVQETLFTYWPEPLVYSNVLGTVSFAGGLPSPGFNGSEGHVLTLTVKAVAEGTADLCVVSAKILANDGNGTDIFSGFSCATFTNTAVVIPEPVPSAPIVVSTTHPDQNETYGSADPALTWNLEAGVTGFSYLLDQAPDTIPDDVSEGIGTSTSFTGLADGVWYFHIKAEHSSGWSDVTHFTIRIDSRLLLAPEAPTVTSATHPDQNAWYQDVNPSFSWDNAAGVTGFSYVLDQAQGTIPDDTSEGLGTAVDYSNIADGVWYFHIRAENQNGWGNTTTYAVRIDTVPPDVSGSISGGPVVSDKTPDVTVFASDALSGIAFIDIYIDGMLFGRFSETDITQAITLSELTTGDHSVLIVAEDASGNSASATIVFTVQAPSIIKRITDTITDVIPEPIRRAVENITKSVTEPIQQVIENLQNSEEVVEITEQIIEPLSRAAAVVGIASVATALPVGLINALFTFLRFGYLFISPFFLRKRRKPWGVVINSFTRKPIKGAVVRVFETEFNKLKESQITDELGRFGFLVDPGSYTLNVEKAGFSFPSKLTHADLSLADIYTGGIITIDDTKDPNISVSIPIDPETEHISERAIAWKRIRDAFAVFLERINWPLLGVGTLVSIWSACIVPGVINTLLVVLYVLLILLKVVQIKLTFKSYGMVLDAETKAPVDLAVIRIFNAETSALVTTRISNQSGKFSAIVRPGLYYVMVTKPPYIPEKTEPVKLSKSETLSMEILMRKGEPKRPATPPTPPPLAETKASAIPETSGPPTPPPMASEINPKNQAK